MKIVRFNSGLIVKLIEKVGKVGYFCEILQESKLVKKPKTIYECQKIFFYNFEIKNFSKNGIEEIHFIYKNQRKIQKIHS